MYTVNDEGFEKDCAVGRGASQFVNHSYSRMDTPGGDDVGGDTEGGGTT